MIGELRKLIEIEAGFSSQDMKLSANGRALDDSDLTLSESGID